MFYVKFVKSGISILWRDFLMSTGEDKAAGLHVNISKCLVAVKWKWW